jgi:hypothetical protein
LEFSVVHKTQVILGRQFQLIARRLIGTLRTFTKCNFLFGQE